MIIDTHCHYNIEPLFSDVEKHWKNSIESNVVGAICIGTNIESSQTALDLSNKYKSMFAAVGIHPEVYTSYIKTLPDQSFDSKHIKETQELINEKISDDINEFEKILIQTKSNDNNKLIAIGEIGLDYYRLKSKGLKRELVKTTQKQILSKQLTLSFKHQLPVILHVRDQATRNNLTQKITSNAYYDTLEIVKKVVQEFKEENIIQDKTVKTSQNESTQSMQKENLKIPPIILHCASGPSDYIKSFLDLGAYIGFAGNVTYNNAPELREILKITPKDRVLLETDAPYLAPGEKKGELCEPHFITETAEFLQNNYQLDLDIIITNTLKVFPQFKKIVKN
jgi:TatD DNase family protein